MIDGRPEAQPKTAPIYAFGSFRFEPARGVLCHGAAVIPLSERLSALLMLLVHANGNVIDKETIAENVWPDTAVSDGNLSQHMYMLRQLLDERARDRTYIVTARGKGYRFVAPVSVVAPSVPVAEVFRAIAPARASWAARRKRCTTIAADRTSSRNAPRVLSPRRPSNSTPCCASIRNTFRRSSGWRAHTR